MDDVVLVQVLHRRHHLRNVPRHRRLLQLTSRTEQPVQLSPRRVLQNYVHLGRVKEKTEHLQNVGVTHVAVDLNLTTQLVHHSRVLQLLL